MIRIVKSSQKLRFVAITRVPGGDISCAYNFNIRHLNTKQRFAKHVQIFSLIAYMD
jgi:hypothetical protein